MSLTYRPEIDGLRAISVIAILIYHAELTIGEHKLMPGAFLAVEVFFVISGFLITSLILKELDQQGGFSLRQFYERRARRLFPALLIVLSVTALFAWLILLPGQLVEFAYSLLAALFFVSNIYWDFSLQEYGAPSGWLQPLLHTWTLAVEEQFYILFPLVLLVLYRFLRDKLMFALMALCLLGLCFAHWFTGVDPHSSFYSLASRFWELLAGAILAVAQQRAPHPNPESSLRRVLNVVGLVLIGGSFIFIEFEHHPGFITVFTVLGTVMIIAFSGGRDLVTRLLASKPFVAIGLMSYSLYLWHYPIFAYARHIQTDITVTDKLIWMALSLALAIPSYRFIEKPFRNRQLVSQRGLWSTTIVLAGLLVAFSLFVIQDKGSRQRFADLETLYGINEFDTRTLKQESYEILAALAEEHGFGPSMPLQASEYESSQLWYSANPDTHKVLIVGVSASIDLFNALYLNQHRLPLFEFARFGISKELRPENVDSLLAAPNFRRADTVLVYMAINGPTVERYQNFVRNLAASGKEIVIVSHPAAFKSKNNESLFDWFLQHSSSTRIDPRELDHLYFQNQDRRSVFLDAIVQALAEELSLPFMNMWDLVCDEQRETCSAITPDGYRTFYDHVHWTTEGADFFGRRIAERGWLETLRQ